MPFSWNRNLVHFRAGLQTNDLFVETNQATGEKAIMEDAVKKFFKRNAFLKPLCIVAFTLLILTNQQTGLTSALVAAFSILLLIEGKMAKRPAPIAFESDSQLSLTDNRYKIYSNNKGKTCMLFDLIEDPGEKNDLAAEKPEILKSMKATLAQWRRSCKDSLAGKDYK